MSSPYRVQSLDRVMALLRALEENGRHLSLGDLAEAVGLSKSTVFRLAAVLEGHGMVTKDPGTGNYSLGLRLFELGSRAVGQIDFVARARPHLERLSEETGEASHLCRLHEGEVLFLAKIEPDHTVRVSSTVGGRKPAHATSSGKALLAHLDAARLDDLVRARGLRSYTRKTVTTYARLKRDLALVRSRGYAVSDEELEMGVRAVAAPVRDHGGGVVASLSVAGPAFRITPPRMASFGRTVAAAASRLSADLGHQPLGRPA